MLPFSIENRPSANARSLPIQKLAKLSKPLAVFMFNMMLKVVFIRKTLFWGSLNNRSCILRSAVFDDVKIKAGQHVPPLCIKALPGGHIIVPVWYGLFSVHF